MILAKALGALWLVFLLTCVALFVPAGTLSWTAGWIFLLLFFGWMTVLALWLSRHDPGLLMERLSLLKADQPVWDRIWVLLCYALSLAWLVLISLDARRWHRLQAPLWLQLLGALLLLCALTMIVATMRTNRFLSPLVRLQSERGHTLVSDGPYASVRHPLYSGACLFYLGVPLFLGSWEGFACAPLFMGLLYLRAVLEERLLCRALPGYEQYMQEVPRRFLPRFSSRRQRHTSLADGKDR